MTCIVGLQHGGHVYIGGDSVGAEVDHYHVRIRGDPKVFRKGEFVFGFTSSFRMGQILRYSFEPPTIEENLDGYMSTTFIDAVRAALRKGGFAKKKEEVEQGGTFLVAIRGRLFSVEDDYQVGWTQEPYASVGCGYAYALGSLASTQEHDPVDRVQTALQVAAHFSAYVRPPFTVLRTPEPAFV